MLTHVLHRDFTQSRYACPGRAHIGDPNHIGYHLCDRGIELQVHVRDMRATIHCNLYLVVQVEFFVCVS